MIVTNSSAPCKAWQRSSDYQNFHEYVHFQPSDSSDTRAVIAETGVGGNSGTSSRARGRGFVRTVGTASSRLSSWLDGSPMADRSMAGSFIKTPRATPTYIILR